MQEKTFKRGFKGVWIPSEIYLYSKLNWTEKILFTEIHSLDNKRGCFASNAYFAKFLGIKNTVSISVMITKLKNLGLIEEVSFDGRYRTLKVPEYCREELEKYQFEWEETEEQEENCLNKNTKADLTNLLRQGKQKCEGRVNKNVKYNNRGNNREINRGNLAEASSAGGEKPSKMNLSSVIKEKRNSAPRLTKSQLPVLISYRENINKYAKEKSKTLIDMIPPAIIMFEDYFKGQGVEKLCEAIKIFSEDDYWGRALLDKSFLRVPKNFFGLKFLENNVLAFLIKFEEYGNIHKTEISQEEREAIEAENDRQLKELELSD